MTHNHQFPPVVVTFTQAEIDAFLARTDRHENETIIDSYVWWIEEHFGDWHSYGPTDWSPEDEDEDEDPDGPGALTAPSYTVECLDERSAYHFSEYVQARKATESFKRSWTYVVRVEIEFEDRPSTYEEGDHSMILEQFCEPELTWLKANAKHHFSAPFDEIPDADENETCPVMFGFDDQADAALFKLIHGGV